MKDLTINVKLNREEAKRAAAEHIADAKDMAEATKDSVADQTQAISKGAKAGSAAVTQSAKVQVEAMKGTAKAAGEAGAATREAGKAGASGMIELSHAVTLAQSGFSKLLSIAQDLRDTIQEAAKISRDLGKGFVNERERVAELAAIMGKPADNAFVVENAKFNSKTGMSPAEGLDFRSEFQNVAAQYAGKSMSQKEYEQYEEQAAKLGTARKLEPGVAGDFFGSVLGFKDFSKYGDEASEEALGTANSSIEILKRGKGDNAVLVRNLAMFNSSLLNEDKFKGAIHDPNVSATIISAAAQKSAAGSYETGIAAMEGLRDFGSKKTGPFLKQAGVDPSMDPITALRKIQPVVEAEAQARGLTIDDILKEKFEGDLPARSIGVLLNQGVSGGIFDDREALLAGKVQGMPAIKGKGPAMQTIKEYEDSERGAQRRAEAATVEADLTNAAENSRMVTLRQQAEADLKKNKEIDTTGSMLFDNFVMKPLTGWMVDPREVAIESRMGTILQDRAKAKGIDLNPSQLMGYHSVEGMNANFGGAMNQIEKAGGNPLAPILEANTEALKANTKAMETERQMKQQEKPGPTIPPVRPAAVPARPTR